MELWIVNRIRLQIVSLRAKLETPWLQLRGVLSFPLFPARVEWPPLHSTEIFKIENTKTELLTIK